ncbi:MAG: stage II sporulation protein M [Deltaproteobacteria bacterium]|nr:stage II sporulation protein M [Deltaproteobacteria bacterium]
MSPPGRNVGRFVRRRRAGWERLELLAGQGGRLSLAEVEDLDRLYRRAAGDLAYAHTAFPGSDVEGYLSQVTARAYALLHRRRQPPGRARRLFAAEIPATFRRSARLFGLAALLLLSGMAAGALAVAFDPAAAALVPPEVRAAVEARRMWTDSLLGLAPGAAGSALARHNIAVSALVLAGGLTGGLLTAWLLFTNGLLLGAVAALCAREDMLRPFLSFVAAHAPAELLAVLLAGQAGFLVARALVAPGEWPRREALAAAGGEAARLLWLVVAILLVVGLVESTVSPGRLFPLAARVALGLGLAGAVLLYLAWPGRQSAGAAAGAGW